METHLKHITTPTSKKIQCTHTHTCEMVHRNLDRRALQFTVGTHSLERSSPIAQLRSLVLLLFVLGVTLLLLLFFGAVSRRHLSANTTSTHTTRSKTQTSTKTNDGDRKRKSQTRPRRPTRTIAVQIRSPNTHRQDKQLSQCILVGPERQVSPTPCRKRRNAPDLWTWPPNGQKPRHLY